MHRDQLIEDLSLHTDLANGGSKAAAKRIYEFILTSIETSLTNGDEVNLPSFGKFKVKTLASGKRVPKFTASAVLKQKIPQNATA